MIQINWLHAFAGLCINTIAWFLIGYFWPHPVATSSGTASTTASASAVIPVETIEYIKVYVHDGGEIKEASKAIIPIIPASSSLEVRDGAVDIDMQCAASGTVDATIYNNQVYAASGTTMILQTASWTVKQQIKEMSLLDIVWANSVSFLIGVVTGALGSAIIFR